MGPQYKVFRGLPKSASRSCCLGNCDSVCSKQRCRMDAALQQIDLNERARRDLGEHFFRIILTSPIILDQHSQLSKYFPAVPFPTLLELRGACLESSNAEFVRQMRKKVSNSRNTIRQLVRKAWSAVE